MPIDSPTAASHEATPTLTRAQVTAWNMYVHSVNQRVQMQLEQFRRGERVTALILAAPSETAVHMVELACRDAANEARHEAVDAALHPVIDACDAIDNSHTKSETVKAIRAELEEAYQALRAMKELPPSVDAVARSAGGSTE